ncbi:MAG: hypothetical protein J6R42_00945, partial [Clostridia bacterium]|nr:hypothetical protein [Clostridia bacterium]
RKYLKKEQYFVSKEHSFVSNKKIVFRKSFSKEEKHFQTTIFSKSNISKKNNISKHHQKTILKPPKEHPKTILKPPKEQSKNENRF